MGKSSLEPFIMEEIEDFIDHFITPNTDKPISVDAILQLASCNIVIRMFYGSRLPYGEETLTNLVTSIRTMFNLMAQLNLFTNIPFIGLLRKYLENKFSHHYARARLFNDEQSSQHKSTFDENHLRDVFDRYLMHSQTMSCPADKLCFSGR